MSTVINNWSVASAFNAWGFLRSRKLYDYAWRTGVPLEFVTPEFGTERVADCIRALGYNVQCGTTPNYSIYIILSISKVEHGREKFYYGSKFKGRFLKCHQDSHRILAGERTIYNEANLFSSIDVSPRGVAYDYELRGEDLATFRASLFDISDKMSVSHIKNLIDQGSKCNRWAEKTEDVDKYFTGVSTIGNSLPNEIVHALKEFTCDCSYFVKEQDYEFYIPECMFEGDMACPVAEESTNCQDGGSAVCDTPTPAPACLPECAVKCKKNNTTNSSSSDSDSDSDSDGDC